MSPTIRITTAVLGAVSLIAAAVLAFVVVPGQAQLPADTDSARTYTGQVDTLLNAEALASADLANILLTDLPITIDKTVVVTGVADGLGDVSDSSVVSLPDGTPLLETSDTFTVDRKTMEAEGSAQGLVIGWPIGPDQADTAGWSGSLQTTVPFVFDGVEEHAGVDALRFTGVEAGRIVDTAWLETVPTEVPAGLLGILAGALDAPAAVTDQLAQVVPTLPNPVPLAYLVDASTTYWVHPETGIIIDVDVTETRSVALDVPGMDATPLAPVLALSYQGEADSVAATVVEADDLASQLQLFGTTLPLILTVLGIGLLLVAAITGRRKDDAQTIHLGDGSGATADAQPLAGTRS